MKKLTIFVDMDGTIENLLDVWLRRINEKYKKNVTCSDIVSWRISAAYEGLEDEEIFSVIDDSIWDEIEPIEGAKEALEYFKGCGHHVYIVTATSYESVKPKMDHLLFKWFPFMTWDDVIITSTKQLLRGDVMIDDGPHNLIGGHYRKILMDAPYNRNIDDEGEGIIRVTNWKDIVGIIDGISEE